MPGIDMILLQEQGPVRLDLTQDWKDHFDFLNACEEVHKSMVVLALFEKDLAQRVLVHPVKVDQLDELLCDFILTEIVCCILG